MDFQIRYPKPSFLPQVWYDIFIANLTHPEGCLCSICSIHRVMNVKHSYTPDPLIKFQYFWVTYSPPVGFNFSKLQSLTEKLTRSKNCLQYMYCYELRSDGTPHSHILVKYGKSYSDLNNALKAARRQLNVLCVPCPVQYVCDKENYMQKNDPTDAAWRLKNNISVYYTDYYQCPTSEITNQSPLSINEVLI